MRFVDAKGNATAFGYAMNTPMGAQQGTLTLAAAGGALNGKLSSPQGEIAIMENLLLMQTARRGGPVDEYRTAPGNDA